MSDNPTHIKDLIPDPHNSRQHNPRNIGMIADAMQEVGAARSIVIDDENVVLCGNGAIEAAAQAGITNVRVIEADGNEIIAVRRRGLTREQKIRLALFDNRTTDLSRFDGESVVAFSDEGLVLGLFSEEEVEVFRVPDDTMWAEAANGVPSGDKSPFEQMTFTLSKSQADLVRSAIGASKASGPFETDNENSNGNALHRIVEHYLSSINGPVEA